MRAQRTHDQAGLTDKCGKDWMRVRLRVMFNGDVYA